MLAAYIPQQLFNMGAVSIAKISIATSRPIDVVAAQVMDSYSHSFDDTWLVEDVSKAATQVIEFFNEVFPPKTILGNLTQMQFCIKKYHTNGQKRRVKIFGGTLFNKNKEQIGDKVKDCLSGVVAYHYLLSTGALPLAPDDWHL